MKKMIQSLAVISSVVLMSSCIHYKGGSHDHSSGQSCGCSAEKGACKCSQSTDSVKKDGEKAECQDCKKGS